ncbi:JAB domain-containing protein [Fulvivirga sp. M361]|uniref:RadC family protein n=1 Tax=Fulvivirga sp. M361 TaxID=2594266 RepID=UPI00117B1373|nr:DNA repair protein RadC [Fulvivirga sp. M361]TRX49216.1 JAB domain-containing protein [Fulvivirga sp. M361]
MKTYRYLNIKDWAEEDRPREKLSLKGKSALSEAELIAIIIGSGTPSLNAVDVAKGILSSIENDLNRLAKLSVNDLKKFKGIGEAKAIGIVAAMELGRRRKEAEVSKKPKITCSNDVYKLMGQELMDLSHEEFWCVLLSKSNIVIKKQLVSSGGVSGTVADPRIIFKAALEELASGIILVHNHPSGNLKPSQQDIRLTQKMKEAGKTLDVSLLDHLIFTDNGYFSFTDENLL